MIIGEIIKVAFQSIRANKLRAVLTMLGVIIGVGAVIAVVALGTGAQRAVEERIDALGAQLLTISPGQSFKGGRASEVRVSLTVEDANALRDQGKGQGLAAVVPEIQRSLQVKYGKNNYNINILGTTPNYVDVPCCCTRAACRRRAPRTTSPATPAEWPTCRARSCRSRRISHPPSTWS
jgi:putative ABC transport system permease protein